jgi:hypothetical protein
MVISHGRETYQPISIIRWENGIFPKAMVVYLRLWPGEQGDNPGQHGDFQPSSEPGVYFGFCYNGTYINIMGAQCGYKP